MTETGLCNICTEQAISYRVDARIETDYCVAHAAEVIMWRAVIHPKSVAYLLTKELWDPPIKDGDLCRAFFCTERGIPVPINGTILCLRHAINSITSTKWQKTLQGWIIELCLRMGIKPL